MIVSETVLLNSLVPGQTFRRPEDAMRPYLKSDYAPGGLVVCLRLEDGHGEALDPNGTQVVPATFKAVAQ